MDQAQLLAYLLDVVEAQQLPYAITGSHATITYGEARLTIDIDVVIALTPDTLRPFCEAFPFDDFYVSEDGARTAVERGGSFNIIHPESGLKIDVIVPQTEFDVAQLDRAIKAPSLAGREALVISPEDIILNKMSFYAQGGSEKHLRDIAGVLKIMGARVDRRYIEQSAPRLGVEEVWKGIVAQLPGSD